MSLFGDINEVKIMGNMTANPELRYTGSGTPVLNISVATNRRYKAGEEWKDETEFHNIVVFGSNAEQLAKRTSKGTRILVMGRNRTSSWDDSQTGKKNYRTEIIADDVFLIDRYEKGKSDELAMPEARQMASGNNPGAPKPPAAPDDDVIDPDDLPF